MKTAKFTTFVGVLSVDFGDFMECIELHQLACIKN